MRFGSSASCARTKFSTPISIACILGSGAYGVEAAAQRYLGKPASQLKLAEAATLAGLVKSPSRLAPSRNPAGAEHRAQVVLMAMAEAGFISESAAKSALAQPARALKAMGAGSVNYVADWIMDVLDDLVGRVDQDLVVETRLIRIAGRGGEGPGR